jgi:SpoVK/Ycf46/Vps4 family AAA+-type ATPase
MKTLRNENGNIAGGSSSTGSKKNSAACAVQLLPKLFEASLWNQQDVIEKTGREIAQLIQVTHPSLSKKILKHFESSLKPTKIFHRPEALVDLIEASQNLDNIILPDPIEREVRAIVSEHHRADELKQFKLSPRHKVLLYGPPGNGKTLLAEGLSNALEVPFLPVKYTGLIDSHLGGTGRNLQHIFEYAATGPCVLFMDEFDGVAIDRSDSKDIGEIRRVTNQLLILLDKLPASCLFVAATNAEELLDKAVQRRFDYIIHIPTATHDLRLRCALRELATDLTPGHDISRYAESVAAIALPNLSAVVKLCQRLRRDLVLNNGEGIQTIIEDCSSTYDQSN